jgi:hypothetical protein
MHTRLSLALNESWDIFLDGAGNIAQYQGALATAQNLANECRLFTRDAYFQQDRGIPHYLLELGGKTPVKPLLRTYIKRACLGIPDILEIKKIELEEFDEENRTLSGHIQVTTQENENVDIRI